MLAKCPRSGSALYILTITFNEDKAHAKVLRQHSKHGSKHSEI